MNLIASRYARALFEAASAADAVDAIAGDLSRLDQALEHAGLRALIMEPDTPRKRRAKVLHDLVTEAHQLTKNLIDALLARRRWEILGDLSTAFDALVRVARGTETGIVESPFPLDDEQMAALASTASRLSGKQVTLELVIAAELLGGVRLRVGNTLYDCSVATALEDLERQLMSVPIT